MTNYLRNLEEGCNFNLESAIQLAEAAHEGQPDKGDAGPYIRHPLRVMKALEPYGTAVQMVAILHDVVEDTGIIYEDLEQLGVPEDVIEAIRSVTKIDKNEKYEHAISRAKQSRVGSLVKIADNRDNANKKRLAMLPEEQRDRLTAKYDKALVQLIENDEWLALQVSIIEARIEALNEVEPEL